MKKILISCAVALLTIAGIQAQESKTVKAESTLKSDDADVSVKEIKQSSSTTDAIRAKSTAESTAPTLKDSNTGMDVPPTKPAIAPNKKKSTVSKSPKAETTQDEKQAKLQSETAVKNVKQSPSPNMATKPKKD